VQAQSVSLAMPQIRSESVFFTQATAVALPFDLPGATVFYGLNAAPSKRYQSPLQIRHSCTLYAVAHHPDFAASAVAHRRFFHVPQQPQQVVLTPAPTPPYSGKGAVSLHDLKKGGTDLHDGNWLGFQTESVQMEVVFKNKKIRNKLILSSMSQESAWILPMRSVVVMGAEKDGTWKELGRWTADSNTIRQPVPALFIEIPMRRSATNRYKIDITPFGLLPAGHPGAGSPAWLFLDELIFE
jgi:hexosaminidase